jgi:urease accessory protein
VTLLTRVPVVVALLAPTAAAAHGNIPGVGAFYAGLLHPLLVPVELLFLLAIALMLGGLGREASRFGVPLLGVGIVGGLIFSTTIGLSGRVTTALLLGATVLAALSVAAAIRLPLAISLLVSLGGGVALGLDAAPDETGLSETLVSGAATLLGAIIVGLVGAALVLGRRQEVARIACRVAGSWIASVAILYFAWLMVA